MFSLKRLHEKVNKGKQKNATKRSREKPLKLPKPSPSFLSLETDKSPQKNDGDSNNKKSQKPMKKSEDKLGISWKFYNKVVITEETLPVQDNNIHLVSGSEIIKNIGKHKNKCMALHKTLEKEEKIRKRSTRIQKKLPNPKKTKKKNRKISAALVESKSLTPDQKPKTGLQKSYKKQHKSQNTQTDKEIEEGKFNDPQKIQMDTQTRSLDFYKKRQRIQNFQIDSKPMERKSNESSKSQQSLSFTPKKKEKEHYHKKDIDLSLEMAEFYKSLNEDIPPEVEEINVQPTVIDDVQPTVIDDVQPTEIDAIQSPESPSQSCDPSYDKCVPHYYTEDTKSCLGSKLIGKGSLLVALFPNTKIFISGNFYLKLILGSVSVLGYKFKEGEEHPVFSPQSHSALSINVLDGVPIKSFDKEKLEEHHIPFDWTQEFQIVKDKLVAIVKLSSYRSNMTRLFSEVHILQERKAKSFDIDIWKEAIGIHLIEESDDTNFRLLHESKQWSTFLDNWQSEMVMRKDWCLVITGGKNVGKSTFLKFIINSLLSHPEVTEIACLDLDPGQPEFALSTCLTLSRIFSPLLGPSFSHREKKYFNYQKRILYGELSVDPLLREYMEVVSALVTEYRNFNCAVPLVVNTMGFTNNLGFDIMTDVLRIVQPTHVITIESPIRTDNYPIQLHPDIISSINRGIVTSPGARLQYNFTIFPTVSKPGKAKNIYFRELNQLGYLSGLWKDDVHELIGSNCKPPVKIDWTTVAVHVQGSFVPQTHILQSINASFVALCKVDAQCLKEVGKNMPLHIPNDRLWFRSNMLIGWGVVKGIDPMTRQIYVLTALRKEEVSQVNVIALTKLQLPQKFYQIFSFGDAPYRQRYQ